MIIGLGDDGLRSVAEDAEKNLVNEDRSRQRPIAPRCLLLQQDTRPGHHRSAPSAPLREPTFFSASPRLRVNQTSTQFFHHRVGHFVIAPHGLHVIVVVERVDELEEQRGVFFAHINHRLRAPGELGPLRLAEHWG